MEKRAGSSRSKENNPTVPDLPKWDPTNWAWNAKGMRSLVIAASVGFTSFYLERSPLAALSPETAAVMHLFCFATWFGTMIYTTFVAGIIMYKSLPRRTFGKLQSKLFPSYFRLCVALILIQVATLERMSVLRTRRCLIALGSALALTVCNMIFLEPAATRVMFQRHILEDKPDGKDSDAYQKLGKEFGKLHGMSALSNLLCICIGIYHGWGMGAALVAC